MCIFCFQRYFQNGFSIGFFIDLSIGWIKNISQEIFSKNIFNKVSQKNFLTGFLNYHSYLGFTTGFSKEYSTGYLNWVSQQGSLMVLISALFSVIALIFESHLKTVLRVTQKLERRHNNTQSKIQLWIKYTVKNYACSQNLLQSRISTWRVHRASINEYINDDISTAEIVAHEIGHNLNMSHDFASVTEDFVKVERFCPTDGSSCTNING